jgi:hypothetical protein
MVVVAVEVQVPLVQLELLESEVLVVMVQHHQLLELL